MERQAPVVDPDAPEWRRCSALSLRQAEELLDWLESNGYATREVSVDLERGVTVRWWVGGG
jgi:hypothetical protein